MKITFFSLMFARSGDRVTSPSSIVKSTPYALYKLNRIHRIHCKIVQNIPCTLYQMNRIHSVHCTRCTEYTMYTEQDKQNKACTQYVQNTPCTLYKMYIIQPVHCKICNKILLLHRTKCTEYTCLYSTRFTE